MAETPIFMHPYRTPAPRVASAATLSAAHASRAAPRARPCRAVRCDAGDGPAPAERGAAGEGPRPARARALRRRSSTRSRSRRSPARSSARRTRRSRRSRSTACSRSTTSRSATRRRRRTSCARSSSLQPDYELPRSESPRFRDFFAPGAHALGGRGAARASSPRRTPPKPVTMKHTSPVGGGPGRRGDALGEPGRSGSPGEGGRALLPHRFHRQVRRGDRAVLAGRRLGARDRFPPRAVQPPYVAYYLHATDAAGVPLASSGDADAPLRIPVPDRAKALGAAGRDRRGRRRGGRHRPREPRARGRLQGQRRGEQGAVDGEHRRDELPMSEPALPVRGGRRRRGRGRRGGRAALRARRRRASSSATRRRCSAGATGKVTLVASFESEEDARAAIERAAGGVGRRASRRSSATRGATSGRSTSSRSPSARASSCARRGASTRRRRASASSCSSRGGRSGRGCTRRRASWRRCSRGRRSRARTCSTWAAAAAILALVALALGRGERARHRRGSGRRGGDARERGAQRRRRPGDGRRDAGRGDRRALPGRPREHRGEDARRPGAGARSRASRPGGLLVLSGILAPDVAPAQIEDVRRAYAALKEEGVRRRGRVDRDRDESGRDPGAHPGPRARASGASKEPSRTTSARVLRLRAGDTFVAFDPATAREADAVTVWADHDGDHGALRPAARGRRHAPRAR